MATKGKRAAIYLRVSTGDQTTENQRLDLGKLAELRGWEVVAVFADEGVSGTKDRDQRPGLDALLKDARRRRFDVVLFWAVDRLGRSTAAVTRAMEDLDRAGIQQFYWKESMDTSTAHGRAMLEMAAVFARLEREMIVARVNAGLARAKANGVRLGRPNVEPKTEAAILAALDKGGEGIRKIARRLGCGVSTVQRVKAAAASTAGGAALAG